MHSNYELLIEEDDPAMSQVVPLYQSALSIGRKPGNTILLGERNVSRHHARLVRAGDAVEIEDLNSYTGVLLNGQRITRRALLQEGDQVQIGDYRLALRRVAQATAAALTQTVMVPLPSPRMQLAVPVRDRQSQHRTRRVWLTLTMAGLGLLGGLLLNRQSPGPQKRTAPVSTQALHSPRTNPQSTPPLPVHREPTATPDNVQAKPQSEATPKLRRQSTQPHLHDRRTTTAAGTAKAPTVAALDPPPEPGEARLAEAQTHYIHGEFAAAIRVARELTTRPEPGVSLTRAWRLLGAAACRLGDLELLNEAYRRVDPASRQYLQYVCEQANVTRSGGRFVLAR